MPSLIWHIVKKDFRSLRLYLAIWWGLLVVSALDVMLSVHLIIHPISAKNQVDVASGYAGLYIFFLVVDVVMLALVVDAILKNDSPIDEKAFWRTRPIGHGRMFAAKLASLGLLCFFVPGIIYLAGHLVFGFNAGEFLRLLGQFVVIQGPFVAVVACAAVLYSRTIQGLLSLVIIVLSSGVIASLVTQALPDGSVWKNFCLHLSAALDVGWNNYSWILLASVLVVAALMYAGQGRRAGKLALVCGFMLNWAAGLFFANNGTSQSSAEGNWVFQNPARNDAVKLSVEPSSFVDQPIYSSLWRIYGWINNASFPELKDSAWRIENFSSELAWPGAKPVITSLNNITWDMQPSQLINAPAAIAAAGYGRLAWPTVGTWRDFPLAMLDNAQLARIKKEPADLTAKVYVESGHLQRIAEMPAREGAAWRIGVTTTRLRSVTLTGPPVVDVILDNIGPWWLEPESSAADSVFLLYNPKMQECVEGALSTFTLGRGPSFTRQQQNLAFNFTNARGQPAQSSANPPSLAAWLADAHLVELGFAHDQYFYVPVTVDSFLLPAKEPADEAAMQN